MHARRTHWTGRGVGAASGKRRVGAPPRRGTIGGRARGAGRWAGRA
eukprot:gene12544-biopygen885